MEIKLFYNNSLNINLFKTIINTRLEKQVKLLKWDDKCIDFNKPEPLQIIFEKQEGVELLIMPGNLLEYPLPSEYYVVALIDVNDFIKDKQLTDYENYVVVVKKTQKGVYANFDTIDLRNKFGKVSIAGFGPGDPDLLTVKAMKAIENADVIFYDSLINQDFLTGYSMEKVFVGKRKGNHSQSQEEIDKMLYLSAISGKRTVRLKGGDPFIYGRGGEEFDYLHRRFVNVEVIPGITAAFGAAASAGISLTHRGISSSVAFCTGFPKTNRTVPNADTLVFYMSASNLRETALLLIKKGRSGNTPVALIRNATLSTQQTLFSNLQDIAQGKSGLSSPMVAIIGEVAIDKNLPLNQILEAFENTNTGETISANAFAGNDLFI